MSGVEKISAERERQVNVERWSQAHDDRFVASELARAACCYAMPPALRDEIPMRVGSFGEGFETCSISEADLYVPEGWPFVPTDWKPDFKNRERELVRAGALIAAEIDRLERLQK